MVAMKFGRHSYFCHCKWHGVFQIVHCCFDRMPNMQNQYEPLVWWTYMFAYLNIYKCDISACCKESYIIHFTWNSILIEFPFDCEFFEMFGSYLPALEEWKNAYHYCFSNCQHDDTWSVQSNCVAIIVLVLDGKWFQWIVWVRCTHALRCHWQLPHLPLYESERHQKEKKWMVCILITPTTQIELIETIANKSTCVRVSFAKRLHESKHELGSHIKNITILLYGWRKRRQRRWWLDRVTYQLSRNRVIKPPCGLGVPREMGLSASTVNSTVGQSCIWTLPYAPFGKYRLFKWVVIFREWGHCRKCVIFQNWCVLEQSNVWPTFTILGWQIRP